MDQQAEYPEEPIYEPEEVQDYEGATVAPPLESAFGKYLREYRLLNSLLMSLLFMIIFFVAMWNLIIYVAIGGEGDSEFSDGGAAPAQQQQEKQKVVKLMQRQQKTPPTAQQTFRTTAISDITLPDFNELDVKDLSPVVNAAAPSTGNVGTNNDAMKSALKGIGLSLPKTMQQRCDPKKRVARLLSGGGKEITEAAIIRGLDWLKANQDPEGSWGGKDKDELTPKGGVQKPIARLTVRMTVNLASGFCTPPLGVNLFVASSISKVSIESLSRAILPFFVGMIILLMLITYIPAISLAVPSLW